MHIVKIISFFSELNSNDQGEEEFCETWEFLKGKAVFNIGICHQDELCDPTFLLFIFSRWNP